MPERTRKPCPGCDSTYTRDAADLLCRSCKGLIETGRAAIEANKQKGAELGDAGMIALQVPNPEQSRLTGHAILPQSMDYKNPEAMEVLRAFCRMLMVILPEMEAMPTTPDKMSHFKHRNYVQHPALPYNTTHDATIQYRLGTEEQRQMIHAFWDAVRSLSLAVHQHGIDHGRNLLSSLAAGEITLDALNSDATRGR